MASPLETGQFYGEIFAYILAAWIGWSIYKSSKKKKKEKEKPEG